LDKGRIKREKEELNWKDKGKRGWGKREQYGKRGRGK
jgi:hypothetical protein